MSISISDMDATALGVAGSDSDSGIDLSSSQVATDAITTIDSAISKVAAERSNLGAVQNSLESNINNLDTESENLTSAESNIRDTDMASVMAEYTKLSVITQAATAMLSKANSQPQQVLTLLQG
jgi:Flagellin and related hook-associated proteins